MIHFSKVKVSESIAFPMPKRWRNRIGDSVVFRVVIKLCLLSFLTLVSACSPRQDPPAKVQFLFPQTNSKVYSSTQVSTASGWGIADPTSINQIVCYAVGVSGPEALLQSRECHDNNGVTVMRPGILAGIFPIASPVSLEVPSGLNRTFFVIGFAAASAQSCRALANSTELNRSELSAPFIIGQTKLDLVPGDNDLKIAVSLRDAKKFDDCSGFGSGPAVGPTPAPIPGSTPTPTPTPAPTAPTGLGYTSPNAIYILGGAIIPNVPTISGGPVFSFSVSPPLPTGLVLDSTTGVISGIPSSPLALTSFMISASNLGGSTSTSISITVQERSIAGREANITTSGNHSCAIVGGAVKCWGRNNLGQLGDGTTTSRLSPTQVLGLDTGVQAISASNTHTCAIVNGGVKCWGLNNYGQLGDGTTANSPIPVQVAGLSAGVTAIAVGYQFTCAIVNGGIKCWGDNSYGQLGDGTTTMKTTPVAIPALSSGVIAVAAGYGHACSLIDGGTKCWGYNQNGQLGNGLTANSSSPVQVSGLSTGVQAVAVGSSHSCAIVDGGLQCWGHNSAGQLGNNSTTESLTPVAVVGLASGVQAVSVGNISCAIADGGAFCWGQNSNGEVGDGSTTNRLVPVSVVGLGTGVQVIAAGPSNACALADGKMKCWGYNVYGQLGDGTTTSTSSPVQVSNLTNGMQSIASGYHHSCRISNGGLACWGDNSSGQLGDGTIINRVVPVHVPTLGSSVRDVAAGSSHTCAVVGGGVKCWGDNSMGQLGDGTTTSRLAPVAVVGLSSGVQAIKAGSYHTCAIVNGSVKCWGNNSYGQLGNGTVTTSSVPVQVSGLTGGTTALAAAIGGHHVCAISNGTAKCWGDNTYGSLGNGSTSASSIPVQVSGLSNGVAGITAGGPHSCALKDGAAKCWGFNATGGLGDDTTTTRTTPVAVTGLSTGVTSISAGDSFTCAVSMGGVKCWGLNSSGQLGDGTTSNSYVPVSVLGLVENVQQLFVGGSHASVLGGFGIKTWGAGNLGQLGNGGTSNSASPVSVTHVSTPTCSWSNSDIFASNDSAWGEAITESGGSLFVTGQARTSSSPPRFALTTRKSSNGGLSWSTVDSFEYVNNSGQKTGRSVAVNSAGNVFVAGFVEDGAGKEHWIVRKSSDLGSTWTTVDDFQYLVGQNSEAYSIVIDPAGTIFVGGIATLADGSYAWTIRKSTNAGLAWTTLGPYQYVTGQHSYLNQLSVNPFDSSLWVASSLWDSPTTAFFSTRRSDDGGVSFAGLDLFRLGVAGDTGYSYSTIFHSSTTATAIGVSANLIARRTVDGGSTWSTIFNESFNGIFYSSLVDGDGFIYSAGYETGVGWKVRRFSPNFTSNTELDSYSEFGADSIARGITKTASGDIFVAGYSGNPRRWVVRKYSCPVP